MNPADVRTIFMGSPAFAVPSLRALAEAGYDLRLVVAQPDRRAGRGSRVRAPAAKTEAEGCGIAVYQPESLRAPEAVAALEAAKPDLIVVAAYGRILPRTVLDLPARGTVNVHPSLLPRWRGPSPVAAAILSGDEETGVSIIELVPKMDAGPAITSRRSRVLLTDTTRTLEARLAEEGAALLVEALPGWLAGETVATPQDESRVTTCSLLTKADGHLEAAMTAAEAGRAVRAYDPWPGAYVTYANERLAIWRAHAQPAANELEAGEISLTDGRPAVAFREGLLVLEEVQRSGSKRITGEAFMHGEHGRLATKVVLA